jgi:hypothetical protein
MPEVWEQKGHLRAGLCFRGDIQRAKILTPRELWPPRLAASSDRMWMDSTARTTTGAAASPKPPPLPPSKSAVPHKASLLQQIAELWL